MEKTYKIQVDCANCANLMEDAGRKVKGVKSASINFMLQKLTVQFDDGYDCEKVMKSVVKACKKVEPDCEIFIPEDTEESEENRISTLVRILCSVAMFILIQFIPFEALNQKMPFSIPLKFIFYVFCYLLIGFDVLFGAIKGILKFRALDENFLMAFATIGAFVLEFYKSGWNIFQIEDCNEAIAVMLFYQIGEFFQGYAVSKSRKNITELMDIRPDYANIEESGSLKKVSPFDVKIGEVIIVQPGEKIPLDGIVVEGNSSLDVKALTGESLPKNVSSGDEIISGSINLTGILKIRVSKEFGESTVSKILSLMENASSKKSKSEKFISKFAKVYTPAVVLSAVLLAVIPPVFRILFLSAYAQWNVWFYRALTFLVISCPCALVISIPLSFFAGLGGAGKEGILIKGSNYLEALSKTKIVVFDKTGTLTKGVFEVTGIHHNLIEEEKLLEFAALAECASSHPISKSLVSAYGKEIDRNRISNIEEISGEGVCAVVDGKKILAGNSKLMKRYSIGFSECHKTGTIIHIAIDGEYSGHIVISDVEKDESKYAVEELKNVGVKRIVMLTGDSKKVAESVAGNLVIDEYFSELLPQEKVLKVEGLLASKNKDENLAFVGDGINDAPVLSRSDIGIAMGACGSDAAIEASDVVLMDDNPLKIAKAIKISKKCMNIVRENIIFALSVKFICLVLGALGFANMWVAVFADVGVMLIAILNALRALRVKFR